MENVTVAGNTYHTGTWLDLQPSLLAREQVVTISVLLNGDEKAVKCARFPLVDVKQVSEPPGARSRALASKAEGAQIALGPLRIGF